VSILPHMNATPCSADCDQSMIDWSINQSINQNTFL